MRATRTMAVVCVVVCSLLAACGSPQGEAAVPSSSAEELAAGANGIWDDALGSGWSDWSWGSARSSTSSPVASGSAALSVTFGVWGGLYFRRSTGPVSGMSALEFSVNGGSAAGNKLAVHAVQGNTDLSAVSLEKYCTGGTIPASAWTRCRVPLTDLAPAGTGIDGIVIQEVDGVAKPAMTFDAVALLPPAPPAPTGVTAVASAAAVAVSWAAVSTAASYDVFRATASAGPFTKLTSSAQATTSYTDAAVTAGATYWYQVVANNAVGSSSASATVSATVPAAAASVSIYGDALASGWVDWSWGSTRNLAATSPVAGGSRSISATFQTWGGLNFHRSGSSVSGVTTLELSVNGGSTAGNKLAVHAVQGSTDLAAVALEKYCTGGTIPANAWTRCKVPLSVLLPSGGALDGIVLQEVDGAARPAMYFDELALTGSSTTPPPSLPAAPAGLTATVASGAVSLSWSAVSGATGYVVSRATASGGPFTALTSSPQTATTYRDSAVTAGSTYWYRVAAVNGAGTGPAGTAVSATVPATPVTVSLSPTSTTVDACTAVQFTATVKGASDGAVTWSVQEGAAGGTVDTAGKYTAPSTPGTYHVVATSKASSTASASAAIVVNEHVLTVALNPRSLTLAPGATKQFTATVTTTCGSFTAAMQ